MNKKTEKVKELYEAFPYPNFKNKLKAHYLDLDIISKRFKGKSIKYLDVGCGTGNGTIGMAVRNPSWDVHGIDLSNESIKIARSNAKKFHSKVSFTSNNILENNNFDFRFDLITSFGTIHHCTDPKKAICNMGDLLKKDGLMVIHLYGKEQDRIKFDIREVIDLFNEDLKDYENRFRIYLEVNKYFKNGIMDLSLNDLIKILRSNIKKIKYRINKIQPVPKWSKKYNRPDNIWIDHFCHPCEHTFDIKDVQELFNSTGLKVINMLNLSDDSIIPSNLKVQYEKLDQWKKWRIKELLMKSKKSILLIAEKQDKYE